jgi:hypothetical protein
MSDHREASVHQYSTFEKTAFSDRVDSAAVVLQHFVCRSLFKKTHLLSFVPAIDDYLIKLLRRSHIIIGDARNSRAARAITKLTSRFDVRRSDVFPTFRFKHEHQTDK